MTHESEPLKPANRISDAMADLEHLTLNPPQWLKTTMAVPREEGVVEIDGCAIHYFRWGNKSAPGIVMLHGFLAHARCWAFIAPYLAADYHIVAFDMSGMGDSGRRAAYPDDARINELLQVCERTGLFAKAARPTIIAHSYGGKIAAAAMHQHAAKFAGLIICDLMILRPSVLEANADKFRPPGNQNAAKPNRVYPDLETAKKRFVLAPPQSVQQAVLFDYMAYHSLTEVDGGWSWKFDPRVFRREDGYQEKWARIGETVVSAPGRKAIVYGEESLLFNADSAEYIRELTDETTAAPIPMIGIPDAGHHLMLDQPVALVSVIKSILSLWSRSLASR